VRERGGALLNLSPELKQQGRQSNWEG
jgi:hypothetical protein